MALDTVMGENRRVAFGVCSDHRCEVMSEFITATASYTVFGNCVVLAISPSDRNDVTRTATPVQMGLGSCPGPVLWPPRQALPRRRVAITPLPPPPPGCGAWYKACGAHMPLCMAHGTRNGWTDGVFMAWEAQGLMGSHMSWRPCVFQCALWHDDVESLLLKMLTSQ